MPASSAASHACSSVSQGAAMMILESVSYTHLIARAFGGLSEPVGDSARWAYPSDGFSQPPAWAAELADQVFEAGVLTEYDGTGTVTACLLYTSRCV